MRCRVCNYRLWQLTTPRCPECGTPFRPSEFEFAPGSVQFCCPDCKQAYYGTGPKGHLEPPTFTCVSCGRALDMDEMILLPTEGIEEDETRPETVPWLDTKLGRFRAWWNTVGMALVRPADLMKLLPLDSSVGRAIWFGTLTHSLAIIGSFAVFMIFSVIVAMAIAGGGGPGGIAGAMLCTPLMALLLVPILVLVWSCLVHAVLCITGKNVKPLSRTIQAVFYSAGANIITAIPCLGMYIGWIWNLISQIIMLKEGHGISARRAIAAVVLPLLLAIGVPVAILVPAVRGVQTAASGARAVMQRQMSTSSVTAALTGYCQTRQSAWPSHAIELVTADLLRVSDLVDASTATMLEQVPIGDTTLAQLEYLSAAEQDAIAKDVVDAMPPNVIAHRLGDFVFTYHGIDLANADPNLWLAILAPDPERQKPASDPGSVDDSFPIFAGQIRLPVASAPANPPPVTRPIPLSNRTTALASQNALRAQHGLPPLPDIWALKHGEPAVAPPGFIMPTPVAPPAEAPSAESQQP